MYSETGEFRKDQCAVLRAAISLGPYFLVQKISGVIIPIQLPRHLNMIKAARTKWSPLMNMFSTSFQRDLQRNMHQLQGCF